MKNFKPIFVFLIILTIGCKKDEKLNHKPFADFNYSDKIDQIILQDNSTDEDGDALSYQWISLTNDIKIVNQSKNVAKFDIPGNPPSSKVQIKLIVSDYLSSDSITKEIELPESSIQRTLGLGINLTSEKSNNQDYEWYLDQMNTGKYASVNCGPTAVTMAIKWFDSGFDKTPVDARNIYRTQGGWWYTDDIINYLSNNTVFNKTISASDFISVKNQIDLGNIVILCVDMYYVRYSEVSKNHLDKFYTADTKGWGHFIVVKGYKVVDNQLFYEVYDPYSFGLKYGDGTLKGKDRYYRSGDLANAVSNWWNYAIVVSKNSLKSLKGVDESRILHKAGK